LSRLRGGTQAEARTLTEGALTIGRGPANDWVLDDPDRQLSRTHCRITVESGRAYLDDLSTNGIFINGARQPTARDSRVSLNDGDSVRLGDYTIDVTEALAPPPPPPRAFRAAERQADPFGDPLDRLGGPIGGDPLGGGPLGTDPLGGDLGHDFGGDPFAEPATAFRHPLVAKPQDYRVVDPFDAADENRRSGADEHDDLFHGITPSENWVGPSQPDNADAPKLAFVPPKALNPGNFDDFDFDALLGDTPPDQLGAAPSKPELRPPVPATPPPPQQGAWNTQSIAPPGQDTASTTQRGRMAPPVQGTAQGAAVSAAQGASVGASQGAAVGGVQAEALLNAFLEGAGIADVKRPPLDPEATLRAAGVVFAVMVEGLRDVLMSRAAIKNELRVEQTMLVSRDNNALKFSVTPEEAVVALLFVGRRGYKPPVDAAKEAFADIKSHEMAMLAGMQTALMGLLKRFDPAVLETKLQPGGLGGMLPSSRKARVWDLFCATYKDIAREAEDDFQSVFGREFARAYDAQMRKLSGK
jgi:type VI secretion system FHA domain protein